MDIPRLEEVRICPICSGQRSRVWSSGKDLLMRLSSQRFEYSKCPGCGALFMSSRPVEADVAFFYSSGYQPYQNASTDEPPIGGKAQFIRKLKAALRKARGGGWARHFPRCYHQLPSGSLFVDFGCGAGKTLDVMKRVGHRTVGVDFSELAIRSVRQRHHQAYSVDEFWQAFRDESADLVRMNHVVEHLYQPQAVLQGIAAKLKKGGALHIAVPNPAGISALAFRENWHGLDCPRHVILYPPETLVRLLAEAGFEHFEVRQESISKDFARSLGYWFAAKGLYNLNKVEGLMDNWVLRVLLWLPMRLCALVGHGDRYHVVCKRQF